MLSDLRYRLRVLFQRNTVERDLEDELRFHVEQQAAKYITAGMATEDAHRRARLDLGGIEQTAETCRDICGTRFVEQMWQDLRHALRILSKHKVSATIAVLALALALGTTTAIVGVVDQILFKPPAGVTDPSDVLKVYLSSEGHGHGSFSYPQFEEFIQAQTAFSGVAAFVKVQLPVRGPQGLERVTVEFVTDHYFSVLRVIPALGRIIVPDDNMPGGPVVVILSYAYWQRAFGADPKILGITIMVRGIPATVIGVAPRRFAGTMFEFLPNPDVWIPLHGYATIAQSDRFTRRFPWVFGLGRLKPSMDTNAAQMQMKQTMGSITVLPSDAYQFDGITLEPLYRTSSPIRARLGEFFGILLGVSGLVLLAACFNITNLLLGLGAARRKEIAVRLTLGATRASLVRQLLTEALLLGIVAGLLGTLAWRSCWQAQPCSMPTV